MKVGLLTTRGHGDMLSIMRVNGRLARRPLSEIQNYSVTDKPRPIAPKPLIIELDERIDFGREVIIPLNDNQVEAAVDKIVEAGVRSIAVSLLWGFLNPSHESRIADLIRKRHPGVFVSLGSALSRRLGEYERTEAAVVNGYVALAVQVYLDKVSIEIKQKGCRFAEHPLVGEVRGMGLLAGLEIVKNKTTKQNFEPTVLAALGLERECLNEGLIVRAIGDTVAVSPPLIISEAEIDDLLGKFECGPNSFSAAMSAAV